MLEFRILGPLEIWRDGERLALEAARERAVLAALLLQPNRVVAADRLIELLWGDEAMPAKARNTVHTWVWRLRRRLEPPEIFVTRPPGYLLRIEPEQLDLFRFEDLLRRGRQALSAGAPADAAALLRSACALWRGEPLADVGAHRLREIEGARLAELYLQAVESRVEADLAVGRHAELVGELRRLVADYPLREAFCGQLMTALYRSGRQAEALAAYRAQRELLADELGVEPGPALQRIHQAMLRVEAEADQPAPPAADRVAAARRVAVPAQLPAAVAAFTGRAASLEELDRLLPAADEPAVPITVITGTAGVGKTALAVHWAHRVASRFPDGQLYVNLRGYDPGEPVDPAEALGKFLRALGMGQERVPATTEEAAGMYRSLIAGRRLLIMLDNAGSAEQVRPLLPGSAGCLVLVTSRDRLGGLVAHDGARRLTVDVLDPAEAVALFERVIGAGRVRAEPAATAELAHACGFLPLALRIAAAHVLNHPHRGIVDHVAELATDDRLAALRIDGDEQSAVLPAFDQSYTMLPPEARQMFRLLGLVPGVDFTAEAAAVLAGVTAAQARRTLDRLAGAHLVEAQPQGRYAFHDLLRLYARDRAEAEHTAADRVAATGRLYDWYQRNTDAAAQLLYPQTLRLPQPDPPEPSSGGGPPVGFSSAAAARAWLDAERPNLVRAVTHAARQGHRRVAWLLADGLRGYFWTRRYTVDWPAVARAGLAAATAADEPLPQAAAELSLGMAYESMTRYTESTRHYKRAQTLSEQAGWPRYEAAARNNLACLYMRSGQLALAVEQLQAAVALNRELGQALMLAVNLGNLGHIYLRLGRMTEARDHFAEALELRSEVDDQFARADFLQGLGEYHYHQGRLAEALDHVGTALALFEEIGGLDGEVLARGSYAAILCDAGRVDEALEQAQLAVAAVERSGDGQSEAVVRCRLGAVLLAGGRSAEAVDQLVRGLQLARDTGGCHIEVEALIGLANAGRQLGQTAEAGRQAERAVALASEHGFRILEAHAVMALAGTLLEAGEARTAASYAQRALGIYREIGHRLGQDRALTVIEHTALGTAGAGS
ncbi:MAG TPA: BTAD domain-containing putative transcriptional regulator [Pilimelia sp.]|nr:BTAD domain-containing putative transcriptional regulator [Pilimelia sp.]